MITCLEGIDSAGKHTMSCRLAKETGAKVYSFPNYSTPMGKLIKAHLERKWFACVAHASEWSQREAANLDAKVFQAVQLANRMEVAEQILADALRQNIVFDRYWPSGYAYGMADGLDGDYLVGL